MQRHRGRVLLILAAMLLAGCAKKVTGDPVRAEGESSKESAFLAYEHDVRIELEPGHMAGRLDTLRAACSEDRFGACSLLTLDEGSTQARITLRTAPAAIEPLVALAAGDGRIESRSLRGEDLADAVADNDTKLAMLQAHRDNLLGLRAKPGLSVGDTIALSQELARVETDLDGANRTAANQRRRIETNLLTLTFIAPYEHASAWSRLGDAFGDLGESAVDGTTEVLGMLGFGLPFLVVAFPLALLWRALWRRATRRRDV